VVGQWFGNSRGVAAKHYLQVTDDHFRAAAGSKVGHRVGQKASATKRNDAADSEGSGVEPGVLRDSADDFADMQPTVMGDEGLEQPSETRKKRESSSARTIL
jgi:hypothetical protein